MRVRIKLDEPLWILRTVETNNETQERLVPIEFAMAMARSGGFKRVQVIDPKTRAVHFEPRAF